MMRYAVSLIISMLVVISAAGNISAYEYQGIEIRGFISQGYLYSTDNNFLAETDGGTPQFNEAAINFSADVSDRLRFGVQFLARDLGTIGNNEVLLDWAVADYRWRDCLGIVVGNMKLVHGLYSETRDIDRLRTFIFLPQSIYNEGWRESISSIQGAGLYGDVSLGGMGSLSYDVQYGTVNMDSDKGAARLLEDQWPFDGLDLSVDVDRIDVDYAYAGSLKWVTNLEGLVVGASTLRYTFDAESATTLDTTDRGMSGFSEYGAQLTVSPSVFAVDARSYTGSIEFTWRNLVFSAEYMRTTYQLEISNTLFADPATAAAITADGLPVSSGGTVKIPEFDAEGYYAGITYRFTPLFEMGTYYSVYYPNRKDKDGKERVQKGLDTERYRGWLKDICLTTRFDVNENWIFKIEGHKMNGAAVLLGEDNPAPATGDRYEKDWYLYAAKVTFNI
jgi:hypothetical protein